MNLCRLLVFACIPVAATAQYTPDVPMVPSRESSPPIRVDVRLVNVFVNVTDTNGAPVGRLTQSNFALLEDGSPQRIAVFERQSAMPLSMVLAIDTSGSVRKDLPIEQ